MELLEYMKNRRSVRIYTGEPVGEEKLEQILQAGLLSASGRAVRPWELIVVREKKLLKKMAGARAMGAKMLEGADCAVVVLGDAEKTDVWTEDCSVVMANMHLTADSLGVGSCWIQGRRREASDGRTTEEYLRELLEYPEHLKLEAILSLGMPKNHPEPHKLEELPMEKIHWERFGGKKKYAYMEHIAKEVMEFCKELDEMPENPSPRSVDRKEFTLLLSGISACRKIPGIQNHMGYETLYHCENEKDAAEARAFLQKMYEIRPHDLESLKVALIREFSECEQYEQFRTFWLGSPMFSLDELRPEGRAWFVKSRDMAEAFSPVVKERGFYAWDINERIGLCRKAAACGMITDEEFWELTDLWVRQAQVFYHSWKEYAVSCLCGAVYFMRREKEEQLEAFLKLNMNLIRQLFAEGMAWQKSTWYQPQEREWVEMFDLRQECLITKKALEEERIGYMYRQNPEEDFTDCGWRFMAGDETEEYVNEPGNIIVCQYSMVCNIEPSVRAYFYSDRGKQYEKVNGEWREIR